MDSKILYKIAILSDYINLTDSKYCAKYDLRAGFFFVRLYAKYSKSAKIRLIKNVILEENIGDALEYISLLEKIRWRCK